jgi:hypothetical protein
LTQFGTILSGKILDTPLPALPLKYNPEIMLGNLKTRCFTAQPRRESYCHEPASFRRCRIFWDDCREFRNAALNSFPIGANREVPAAIFNLLPQSNLQDSLSREDREAGEGGQIHVFSFLRTLRGLRAR